MSIMLDFISSSLIFGIFMLTVGRVQTNINTVLSQNQHNVTTQTNAVELARQLEFDLAKVCYHVVAGQHILFADSTIIRYNADVDNNLVVSQVQYSIGDTSQARFTENPRDFPLFRTVGAHTVQQNFGITFFKLTYYDSVYSRIPTPITSAVNLQKIRAINVSFRVESPDPVYTGYDTSWAAITWEKMILPRSLYNLNN
jgi:hypothetical protein